MLKPTMVKVKVLYLLLSTAYMSQTQDQKRFTISEVAADELMIQWCITQPSIVKQLDQQSSQQTYHHPNRPY